MRIEQDSIPSDQHRINAYNEDGIQINGHWWHRSVILTPSDVQEWPPTHPEQINAETLAILVEHPYKPEVVLIGTGESSGYIAVENLAGFYRAGIGVEVMNTGAACRSYNVLLGEQRRVAAAFLIAGVACDPPSAAPTT